ncbi:MAG: phosphate ABC transporter, permease protein PstA [Crenarchaeota archaeon 13_1_40CM_3_52_17]|nr:MAG: phosphate ABC transporter, permease protein PstA [Crenarchaeota archaeon 13_1_40CM_3_52_17]
MSNQSFRRFKDKLAYGLGVLCVVLAMLPLASILFEVVGKGLPAISLGFLTKTTGNITDPSSGIGNAIEGTLILIGVTSLIAVPIGLLAGIYLAEFGDNKFGRTIRFLNDVLAEFPSIVIGILAFSVVVIAIGHFSAIAGAVALSIIMLPIVTRTTEESIKLVPSSIRDASMALGIRRWRTSLSIVLVTAKDGVITGILLSIARISGETAPLLLTVLGSGFFFSGLDQPIDALPLRIFTDYKNSNYPSPLAQGWGAALVLIMLVLGLNLSVRLLTRGRSSFARARA